MENDFTPTVIRLVRETLALGEERPILAGQLLFYDLGFTSMDLLDLFFRVEDHFGVSFEGGTLAALARGELAAEAFASDGHLSALGRARLTELLHDSPPEIFPERIHADTLARYCTVGAIARLVKARLDAGSADV